MQRVQCSPLHEHEVELLLRRPEHVANPLLEHGAAPLGEHTLTEELTTWTKVCGEAGQHSASHVLSVLARIPKDKFGLERWHIRRMGDDDVKLLVPKRLVDIALQHADVRQAIQRDVEFSEMDRPSGDVDESYLPRELSGGNQAGDAGASAEIEKMVARITRHQA